MMRSLQKLRGLKFSSGKPVGHGSFCQASLRAELTLFCETTSEAGRGWKRAGGQGGLQVDGAALSSDFHQKQVAFPTGQILSPSDMDALLMHVSGCLPVYLCLRLSV